ncbi:hypothetical protein VTG60DRAFT_649 [Thermothelomyces hinnuleus]
MTYTCFSMLRWKRIKTSSRKKPGRGYVKAVYEQHGHLCIDRAGDARLLPGLSMTTECRRLHCPRTRVPFRF